MDIKRLCLESLFIILVFSIVQTLVYGESYDDDDDEPGNWDRCPWIRNKLKNGRVKIRSKGRIAKFLCESGYELMGKRFATCVRGQWNNPLPACVTRGCHRPPHAANARVTMMYRGAVLNYDCLPGYTLTGGASIYCDGRRWSAKPPACVARASDPHTSCDFEDPDLCGWSHDPTHDFEWKRNQFATPSGHVGTGPSFDHTFGEGKGGFYLYMEASSPRAANDTARLFSPVFPSEYSGGCFIFWYHMFGSTTGGLRVYVKPESHIFGELPPTWTLYGDQGNHWFRGNVTLAHFSEPFQIIIEGIRGSSYIGDTAIDDVSLNVADCESIGNSTDNTSETFSDSCRGRCRESSNSSSACGCNDDCVASHSCCYDFESICTKNAETETDETKTEISTGRTSHTTGGLETDLPEIMIPGTTPTLVTPANSLIPEKTHLYIETTTITAKDASFNASPVFFPSTYTKQSTSPIATSSTSKSTIVTTTITTTTTHPSTTVSITTVPSTITTTTPSTTTTSSSTTTSTTPIPSTTTTSSTITTMQSTTTSTTTPSTTSPIPSITTTSPIPSTTTTTSIPSTTTFRTTSTSTTTKSPIIIVSSTLPSNAKSTSSPRTMYNLRPRNRTTVSINTMMTSAIFTKATVTTNLLPKVTSTESTARIKLTTPIILPNSIPLEITQTASTTIFAWSINPTTLPSEVTLATQEKTRKFSTERGRGAEKSVIESEAHASKTESLSTPGAPVVTIVSVVIVIIICAVVGALLFVRWWKSRKISKCNDESEMKFLSENEVVEYSDSSVLDRINFNP